nr:hypothetical protein [Tanacetum cinerariifolium]
MPTRFIVDGFDPKDVLWSKVKSLTGTTSGSLAVNIPVTFRVPPSSCPPVSCDQLLVQHARLHFRPDFRRGQKPCCRIRHSFRPSSLCSSFRSDYDRLSVDKIGSLVLLQTSFGERRSRQDLQRILHEPEALKGPVFPWRHQDSSMADPDPTGVRAKDIRRLCKNVIDLHPVYLAMLYAVGLTTIWKHVGHHSVFKDAAISMSQFLKFLMARGIPKKSDHQRVIEYENERVLAAKRKAQAAKDKAVGKRAATRGSFPTNEEEEDSAFVLCFIKLRGR